MQKKTFKHYRIMSNNFSFFKHCIIEEFDPKLYSLSFYSSRSNSLDSIVYVCRIVDRCSSRFVSQDMLLFGMSVVSRVGAIINVRCYRYSCELVICQYHL